MVTPLRLCALSTVAILSLSGVAISAPATIYPSNNGFEVPNLGNTGGSYSYNTAGASWTFTGGSGIAANSSGFNVSNATNGNNDGAGGAIGTTSTNGQAAFLQGGDGTLGAAGTYFTQAITVPSGIGGTIDFATESRQFNQGPVTVNVYLDGTLIGSATPTTDTTFTASSVPFGAAFADGASHVLAFAGNNTIGGDRTSFVDNVSVTVVPEPATLSLLGLGGVSLLARRRRSAR